MEGVWEGREKGDIPSADGSSIPPACYSRSDGMFINRLISEIGVRLRTIGGAVDSSIAIKHKSIISIWPLRGYNIQTPVVVALRPYTHTRYIRVI